MAKNNMFMKIVVLLGFAGALNWLLVGLFSFDLVAKLPWEWLVRTVYVLAGASGAWLLGKMLMK